MLDSSQRVQVIEVVPLAGGTFSAQLVPQIADLLERHGLQKRDIEAFAVVSGPGSFTGLRVGLAVIKALAEVLDKPIAAVSLLEAIAISTNRKGRVMKVSLTDRQGKVLFENPSYVFHEQYEVSRELSSFFEEDTAAMGRLSRDFARTLVSSILEGF